MKTIPVFKLFIAKELIKMGYIVVNIEPNRNNKLLTVFFFEDTEQFRRDLDYVMKK